MYVCMYVNAAACHMVDPASFLSSWEGGWKLLEPVSPGILDRAQGAFGKGAIGSAGHLVGGRKPSQFTEAVLLLHCIVLALFGASNTSAGSIWARHW